MIFQRKMVISHDFTIILGVREKYFFAYPPRTKKIAYPVREILASPRRPRKPNPPTGGVRDFVFSRTGYETCHFYFFAYRVRDLEGYVCSGM